MLLALCASLVVGYTVRQIIGTIYPLRMAWQVWLQGGLAVFASLGVYALVCQFTKLTEWQVLVGVVVQRLSRRTRVNVDLDATESATPL
jgi:hypothetical protein